MLNIFKIKKRSGRGFTLIEVLVASFVSFGLAVTLFQVFTYSNRSIAGSIDKLQLMSRTRVPLDRISLYLSSSIRIPGEEEFLYPTTGIGENEQGKSIDPVDPSTWVRHIVFRTGENFLSADFDPEQIMDPSHYTVNSQLDLYRNYSHRVHDYLLWFEDRKDSTRDAVFEENVLYLARIEPDMDPSDPTGKRIRFRTSVWAADNPWEDIDKSANNGNYFLALARHCKDITFRRVGAGGVEMSVLAEEEITGNDGKQTKRFRTTSFIQVPSLTAE